MSDSTTAETLHDAWHMYVIVAALSGPLLKAAGFVSGHHLITTVPGTSGDPFTQAINICALVGYSAMVAAITGLVVVAPLTAVWRRLIPSFGGLLADIVMTGIALVLAYCIWRWWRGLWWTIPAMLLFVWFGISRWIPAIADMEMDEVRLLPGIERWIVESVLCSLVIYPLVSVPPYQIQSLMHFDGPLWGWTIYGAVIYFFCFKLFYDKIAKKDPFQ